MLRIRVRIRVIELDIHVLEGIKRTSAVHNGEYGDDSRPAAVPDGSHDGSRTSAIARNGVCIRDFTWATRWFGWEEISVTATMQSKIKGSHYHYTHTLEARGSARFS